MRHLYVEDAEFSLKRLSMLKRESLNAEFASRKKRSRKFPWSKYPMLRNWQCKNKWPRVYYQKSLSKRRNLKIKLRKNFNKRNFFPTKSFPYTFVNFIADFRKLDKKMNYFSRGNIFSNQDSNVGSISINGSIINSSIGSGSVTIVNGRVIGETLENVAEFKVIALDKNGKELKNCNFPAGTKISLNVKSKEGIQSINTQSASVTVEKCKKINQIRTMSGPVRVENCEGNVGNINTMSGNIDIGECNSVGAQNTMSGSIRTTKVASKKRRPTSGGPSSKRKK
jgi:DUF4097 and DUF4098 domain-containing protein YvlB